MSMNRLAMMVVAGALALPAVAQADASHGAPPPALDDAVAEARAAGKPLVVEFYATWCGPCKMFQAEVLPKPEVQTALGDVVFVQYDGEDGPGIDAAARLGVNGYPTFLALDGAGEVRARKTGASKEPRHFIAFLDRAVDVTLTEDVLNERLKAKPRDPRTLMRAARWYESRGRGDDALAYYRKAARADRSGEAGVGAEAEWRVLLADQRDAARTRAVKAGVKYLQKFPSSEHATQVFAFVALSGDAPPRTVTKLARGQVELHKDNADALNALVYILLAAEQYDVALDAAKRQVALRPDDPNVYDTLAEVFHYKRDRDAALAASDTALAKAGSSPLLPAFKENRARFQAPDWQACPDVAKNGDAGGSLAFLFESPAEEPAASSPADPARVAATKFFASARKAYSRVGVRCAKYRNELDSAHVHIIVNPKGGAPSKIYVLEPSASKPLRKCIVKAFADEKLPPPPAPQLERYTDEVELPSKN